MTPYFFMRHEEDQGVKVPLQGVLGSEGEVRFFLDNTIF